MELVYELIRGIVAVDSVGSCVAQSKAPDVFFGLDVASQQYLPTVGQFRAIWGSDDGMLGENTFNLTDRQFSVGLDSMSSESDRCKTASDKSGDGVFSVDRQRGMAACFQAVNQRAVNESQCNPYTTDGGANTGGVSATKTVTNNGDGTETVREYDSKGKLVNEYTQKRSSNWDNVTTKYNDDGTTEQTMTDNPTATDSADAKADPTAPVAVKAYRFTDPEGSGDYVVEVTYSDGTVETSTRFREGDNRWGPTRQVYRPKPSDRCVAFRGSDGVFASYAIQTSRPSGLTDPTTPNVMDGYNACMCSETGGPLPGHQCPSDQRRWSCLIAPFGPDDAPRPECMTLLRADKIHVNTDNCALVQCAGNDALASFVSTSGISSIYGLNDGGGTGTDCGCFSAEPLVFPAGQCSDMECTDGSSCQCDSLIGCGCVSGGDPILGTIGIDP